MVRNNHILQTQFDAKMFAIRILNSCNDPAITQRAPNQAGDNIELVIVYQAKQKISRRGMCFAQDCRLTAVAMKKSGSQGFTQLIDSRLFFLYNYIHDFVAMFE